MVWRDNRNGNWDIYGYNLSTAQVFPITTVPSDQLHPAIYRNIVVWIDNRNGNWDVYGCNLLTGQEFQITTDGSNQIHPEIYKDIVVWDDKRNTSHDIYGYNLSTIDSEEEKTKIITILLIGLPICGSILAFFLLIFKSKKKKALERHNTESPSKKLEKEEAIVWYKVGISFLTKGKIYFTHEGVNIPRWFFGDLRLPYTAITECSYSQKSNKDNFIMEYRDKNRVHKKLKIHTCLDDPLGALKAYHTILQISQRQGHRIKQRIDRTLAKFVELLEDIGTSPEFVEPRDIDLEIFEPGSREVPHYWKRELGILKLNNSVINSIKVTEVGYARVEVTHIYSPGDKYRSNTSRTNENLVFRPEYHLDFIAKISLAPQIKSLGTPTVVTKRKIIDYEWRGNRLAERLRQ